MTHLWQSIRKLFANPLVPLITAASVTLFIYVFFFVQPAGIYELLGRGARQDLGYLYTRRPWSLIRLGVCFAVLSGMYVMGWLAARRAKGSTAWAVVLVGALLFTEALVFLYPFDAADLFSYVFHGRIWTVYGGNPYIDIKANFPNDPFIDYVAFKGVPSVYGPLWEMLAGWLAKLSGDTIATNIIVFKTLVSVFFGASVGVVWALSRKINPSQALGNVLLFSWNPLILYTTIGNGHNDITIVLCMLAAALAIANKRHTLAMLALTAGILFKLIPIFLMPIAFAIALRDLPNWKARLRYMVVTGLVCVAFMVAAYAPFWTGPAILQWGFRMANFTTSLPAVIYFSLGNVMDKAQASHWVSWSAAGLTGAMSLWQAWLAWRDRSDQSFSRASFWTLMFFLLVTMTWYHMWYGVWVVGFAILLGGREMFLGLFYSITTIAQQVVGHPLFEWHPPFPPKPLQHFYLAAAALGPAWLASVWVVMMNRFKRHSKVDG